MRIWLVIVFACVLLVVLTVGAQEKTTARPQQGRETAPTTRPATTRPVDERPLYVGHRPDEWASYQAMHDYFLKRFVESRGFGLERMVNVNDPRYRKMYADGRRYRVGRVQLISLNRGGMPFAYSTGIDADKAQIKHAPHEPLGDAETDAVAKLKDSMTVVLTGQDGHREMVGAIRATADCTACHHVAQGTLMGAFRYPLEPEFVPQPGR